MISQLLAALGAAAIVIAVAGLAGGWWALAVAGCFALASAYTLRPTPPSSVTSTARRQKVT